MKKSIRIICVILIALSLLPLCASAKYGYIVNDVMCVENNTPTLDGVFHSTEWEAVAEFLPPVYDNSTGTISTPGTVSDFYYYNSKNIAVSGNTYLSFDNDDLYVCARITDPSFCKSDIAEYGVDTKNYVFDGDTFIFSIDPLMKMSNAANQIFYDYSAPAYYVTVDENNTTLLYHVAGSKKGYLDSSLAKSQYNSADGVWTVEFAIPWSTICSDLTSASNNVLSITDAQLSDALKNGLSYSNKATFIYADRSFDNESEEVITLSVSATTSLSTLDYKPGYTQKGNLVKNFGIKFYLNSHVHDMHFVPATAPTVLEYGNIDYYTCSICNNIYLDEKGNNQTTLDDVIILPTEDKYFIDVPKGEWYYESVQYCVSKGYFSGTGENVFSPMNNLTREQFMQVLFNFAGQDKDDWQGPTGFNDVPEGQWYSPAIKWANENEITSGVAPGIFGLKKQITREQFAVLLMNYSNQLHLDVTKRADLSAYKDADEISSWALEGMKWAVAEKLVNGTSSTTLSPAKIANRATATMIFMNYDKYLESQIG